MRIGVIGAGQLGLMLGQAARELGHECVFLDPGSSPPAATLGRVVTAAFDDVTAIAGLAADCDVVTYEFENVPVEALATIAESVPVHPPLTALELAQDRLSEKQLFAELKIPLPGYRRIDARPDLDAAVRELGLPVVLKTRRFGYDGKGQVVIRERDETDAAWRDLDGRPAVAEAWVPFDTEVSVIGARDVHGDVVVWPLTENYHEGGILRRSLAPKSDSRLAADAGDYVHRLLGHLDYVGVLALELFVIGDRLLANEFAPRVHNSGHWTIEGASVSQFTNHIRAIAGDRLEPTHSIGYAGMLNLLGRMPGPLERLENASTHVHDYGKAPRPGRKLGHITVVADSAAERDRRLAEIDSIVTERT